MTEPMTLPTTSPKQREDLVTRLINRYNERFVQLLVIAQAIVALGFLVSGIILLIEEYHCIPDTASKYRGWSIAMTVLFGIIAIKSDHDDVKRKFNPNLYSSKTIAIHLGLIALIPTLIFLLGWLHVMEGSNTHQAIQGLKHWSTCILVYSFTCLLFLWTGSGMFMWHSFSTRHVAKIDTSQLI